MKVKAITIAVAASLSLLTFQANSETWMEDYFNSAGAAMNVTPADVYQTQTQTVMSLGGFAYRAPQRNFQPFSFSPPGYKAGCGGIDAWLGAYGFANKDQFVAALRNIGQNAVGYFFKLALKTMAPEIDATIQSIADEINKLNQYQMSSCQAIKQFVGTTPDTRNMDFEERARTFGSAITGAYGDYFGAKEATKADASTANSVVEAACSASAALCRDSEGNLIVKRDTNILFDALTNSDVYTEDEKNLFISAMGTVIFRAGADPEKGGFEATYYEPTVEWDQFVGKPTGTTSLNIRKCPDTSSCLYTPGDPSTAATNVSESFASIVNAALVNVKDAIINRDPLTDPKTLQVVSMTSVPIYQIIARAVDAGHGSQVVVNQIINLYSEIIAQEIAYHYLVDIGRDVTQSVAKYKIVAVKADSQEIVDLQLAMEKVLTSANASYTLKAQQVAERAKNLETMLEFQKHMYNSLGPKLTANVNFERSKEN